MRIGAALILVFLAYWLFSDLALQNNWLKLIPTAFFLGVYTQTSNSMHILIVPILVNMALWNQHYYSYIFIRVVLYAELMKLVLMLILIAIAAVSTFPLSILMLLNPYNIIPIIAFLALILLNRMLIIRWKEPTNKEYFCVADKAEGELKPLTRKLVIVFIMAIFALHAISSNLKDMQQDYAPVQTFDFDYRGYLVSGLKMSADEKLFLLRKSSNNQDSLNFFLIDASTNKDIKVVNMPTMPTDNITFSGYTLTNDCKYIVVGDKVKTKEGVSIQVYEVATGKLDNRFSDPGKLSKFTATSAIKMVDMIKFNQSGDYFALTTRLGALVELWSYKSGKLIFTEIFPNTIKAFYWLSDRKFWIAYYQNYEKRLGVIVQYEITQDGRIRKTEKKRIAVDMSTAAEYLWAAKSSSDGKYLAIKTHTDKLDTVNVWNFQNEQKIITLTRNAMIKDMDFDLQANRLVLFEELPNTQDGKITFWDIQTGGKQKELTIKRLSADLNILKPYKIKLLDNGKRLMIIGDAVYFISL